MPALPQARKSPRQARSQQMVEVILEATARVLAERGYAGTNTNLVAERAGVSVGSIYQYFPNKDSLVAALHERHAAQMGQAIERVLAGSQPLGLRGWIEAIVQALHKVLEKEFPFFDAPKAESAADNGIYRSVRTLLDTHRAQLRPGNLDLATWTVLQVMESLVHAAVIDPPARFSTEEIATTITEVLMGYLCQAERCTPA